GRLLDMVCGPERARADSNLLARGEAPGMSGTNITVIDPQLQLLAGARGMDLQASGQTGAGGLDRGCVGEHPTPAERIDYERRPQLAAVGVDRVPVAARDRCGLALRLIGVGLVVEQRAQLAIVERRERPWQPPAGGS